MQPNLAQVLNTLAHEIRTPLAVSQGYIKLFLDGRLKNDEDTRRAFEQTRQALGALATMCVDMGKVSALSERGAAGVPEHVTAADFMDSLRTTPEVAQAAWPDGGSDAGPRTIGTSNRRDLVQAVAVVSKAAFDEARDEPHAVRAAAGDDLIVLAGAAGALDALGAGPAAPGAQPVDFAKGGKGLKLIWAAFVLDTHGIDTWTHAEHRASVGFRIPLVKA
jgi:signal transduction histidine kinase